MKTKPITAIILTVFLSSMLSMAFVTPAIAENPVISKVEGITGVCWFHLMTGYMPVGFTATEDLTHYDEEGGLYLDYRNLTPEKQWIRLNASQEPERVFIYWPERQAEEIESHWRIFWNDPAELIELGYPSLMISVWYAGWSAGERIDVTLELVKVDPDTYEVQEVLLVLYEGQMTIPPIR